MGVVYRWGCDEQIEQSEVLAKHLPPLVEGFYNVNGSRMPEITANSQTSASIRDQVERVLNLIRPAVQSDGGDVELVDISDSGVVQVRLHGACVGCPSSSMTLKSGIERNLKQRIPGVTSVQEIR